MEARNPEDETIKFSWKASNTIAILLLFLALPLPSLTTSADPQEEPNPLASLEGLVIDSRTRQPVAEARVDLVRGRVAADFGARNQEAPASVMTDREGHFRFDSIEPGLQTLVVTKRGYVPSPFHVLELNPGTTTTREVHLGPLAKVSGRVVDEADHAVGGARVAATVSLMQPSVALTRLLNEHGIAALTITADTQGEFELFVPADEGKVTLLVAALGYASNRVGPLQVEAGRARKVVVRLPPGLEVRGRVVDEGGAPLSAATIVALRSEPGVGLGFEDIAPRTTSGANGDFLLKGLEKRTYTLRVSHSTHATRAVPNIEIQAGTSQIPWIVLQAQGRISGRVTDAAGRPVAGTRVRGHAGEEFSEAIVSDGDGRFVLSEFPPGASVFLWAEAEGHSLAKKVVTAPESDVVLVLRPHGVLRGRVQDSDTKGPVREFRIWVARGSEERSFRSQDGSFEWSDLPPGRWTLVAQAPGYQSAELHGVEIRSGEPTEGVVFPLRKGVELAGRVVDDEIGKALPDVTVSYRDASEPEDPAWLHFNRNKQITDAEGNFKFEGVPPVKVTVIAESPFHAQARTTVMAGEKDFVEIRLTKGASLSGKILAPDAVTPIPGAHVTLLNIATRNGSTIPTDVAGVFSFDRLSAGRYRLMAEATFGQTQPQDIVLQEGERLGGLILVITPGATVRGKVSGIVRGELEVVNLVVRGPKGFTASTSTDADGFYAIHGVPAGLVKVTAATSAVHPSSYRMVSKAIEIPEGVQELVLDIEFPRAARLHGRVTRAGQPIPFADVSAFPLDPQLVRGFGGTDQDGMYAIEGLSDANYTVSVGGMGARRSVRISGDTILDIELPVS